MIAAAAVAGLLMSTLLLRADEAAKASGGAVDDRAADSSVASGAGSAASMQAAMPYSGALDIGTPKVELFLGYSYLQAVPKLAAGNRLVWLNGGSASIAYNLNRYLGLVADVGAYTNSEIRFTGAYKSTIDVNDANGGVITYLFGPRFSFRQHERFTPFVQVLFGGAHASEVTISNCALNCTLLPAENTFALTAGGGLDVRVHRHFAIRVIQAEYLMTRFEDFSTGGSASQNDMRLSSGIVFRFGGNPPPLPPPAPVTYSCSVTPQSVFPGETIAASGTALNLDPAKTAVYTWSVDGGTVTGVSNTAKIDTTNIAPGAYTLKCHVSEGDKPGENADATAQYTVKAFEPPTVSCMANPRTVISGAPSTITATGVSPQNRPLTYSYSSTAGSVSGSGATATLSTVGAPVEAVTVTCNVVDDKGQAASAKTSVMVTVPVAAPKPVTSGLCSIRFDRDPHRPARVDNEGKACLDEIALDLQRSSGAQLAIVGNAASGEKGGKKLATERAVNTKAYLVGEKGIDSSRIAVYTGSQNEKTVTTTLIPEGAAFDDAGDTAVE
jgi:outer membrane protein OmpA-like peptidoglycan-associated protein